MFKRKSVVVKAIKVLAILTFLACASAIVLAPFFLGETRTVDLAGLIQTLFSYLIAFALAILVVLFFWFRPGFRGIKVFSILVIVIYGYSIFSLPFNIGDPIAWTPAYLAFVLGVFLLGLILAIWTMLYFKRLDKISVSGDEQKNQ